MLRVTSGSWAVGESIQCKAFLFKFIKVPKWFYTVCLLCGVWPGTLSSIGRIFQYSWYCSLSPLKHEVTVLITLTVLLLCAPKHPNTFLFIFPPYTYTLFPNEFQAVVAFSEARTNYVYHCTHNFFFATTKTVKETLWRSNFFQCSHSANLKVEP